MSENTDDTDDSTDIKIRKSVTQAGPTHTDVNIWVDDGEYATVWQLHRRKPEKVKVTTKRAEAGTHEDDGVEYHDIEPDRHTVDFALELAKDDPEAAVQAARDYFAEQAET